MKNQRNILLISRKKTTDMGGLARFYSNFILYYPGTVYKLSFKDLGSIYKILFGNIEVIHLCDATLLPFGFLLKMLLRKPLTLTAHGLDLTWPNPTYQYVLKKLLPKVDFIFLDSRNAIRLLEKFYVVKENIKVVSLGININQFRLLQKVKLPKLSNKITLVTTGNLVARKGHVWFLENVFCKLPESYIYLIIGKGKEKNKIIQTIKKLNLSERVFVLGSLSDKEVGYIYKKADVFVCPNRQLKNNFEGFGLAFGEAAAMGLAVVASKTDGIPEVIKNNQNGLLVKGTPQSFIKAFKKLEDKNFKQKLKKKAKKYTENRFKWEKTFLNYAQIFSQLVPGKN